MGLKGRSNVGKSSASRIRTCDLRLMRPMSYRFSIAQSGQLDSNQQPLAYEANVHTAYTMSR